MSVPTVNPSTPDSFSSTSSSKSSSENEISRWFLNTWSTLIVPSFSNLRLSDISKALIDDEHLFLKIILKNLTAFLSWGDTASFARCNMYASSIECISASAYVNGTSTVWLFLGGKTSSPLRFVTSSLMFLTQR